MTDMLELYGQLTEYIEKRGGKFELYIDKPTGTWVAAMTDDTAHTLCTENRPIPALEFLLRALRHD